MSGFSVICPNCGRSIDWMDFKDSFIDEIGITHSRFYCQCGCEFFAEMNEDYMDGLDSMEGHDWSIREGYRGLHNDRYIEDRTFKVGCGSVQFSNVPYSAFDKICPDARDFKIGDSKTIRLPIRDYAGNRKEYGNPMLTIIRQSNKKSRTRRFFR